MTDVRVLLAEPARAEELDMWRRLLGPIGSTVHSPESSDEVELAQLIADAHVVMVQRRIIPGDVIRQARDLKLIQKIGRNTDNIDIDAARQHGVDIQTALNPSWVGVAEHAIMLMLGLAKQLRNADVAVRTGINPRNSPPEVTTETSYAYNWSQIAPLMLAYGTTLGVVGFGEIGQLVAERARALGMKVYYTRKSGPLPGADADGYQWTELDDLLETADFVTLHVPLTDETVGLIGEREFGVMKSSAYLVNTSRGGVIDQDVLVNALISGQIAGAGLDVFYEEPLSPEHPLVELENVILTPHIAAVRPDTLANPFPEIVAHIQQLMKEVR